jgi:hypothetical protein
LETKSGSFSQKALLKAILQSCLPNRNAWLTSVLPTGCPIHTRKATQKF